MEGISVEVPEAWRCSQALEEAAVASQSLAGTARSRWHQAQSMGWSWTQASYAASLLRPLVFSCREIKQCWLENASLQ